MITDTKEVSVVERKRSGKRYEYHKMHMTLDELISRVAAWKRVAPRYSWRFDEDDEDRITGRVEFVARGKAAPIRALVINRDGVEVARVNQTELGRYFLYERDGYRFTAVVHLEKDGVTWWEDQAAANWWVLAPAFSI